MASFSFSCTGLGENDMNTLEIVSNLLMYLPLFAFNTASVKLCL